MRRLHLSAVLVLLWTNLCAADAPKPEPRAGVLPVGADGKPLNLDFETGTLKDWTAEGTAFADQPIKGDTVFPRRHDNKSEHQGQFWIGGYERQGDKPQGTLTSVSFKVTHPWASFLVGGGPWPTTCVELVRKDDGKVFFRASGAEEENLRRRVVDLQPHLGKEIFIRLVDRHSGHWGHINFDDFRFHREKPNFPPRLITLPPTADIYKYAGLPPEKAAEVMTVPAGFTVKLFAGEPHVHQPIAFCLDHRGRVWVAEAYSYPIRRPEKEAKDRIVIFEDTDGDGKFDKRTVFMEGLNLVSGLEVGFGGVWIGAAPYLLFVPVKDGVDEPAGKPQVLLDGWAYQDTHETLNTFCWGPDGWLYGCHGVFTHSRVGKPGTPDKERVPINAGVWRYHPTKHIFEVFAHGTSNPWGLDFDEHGQAFCEACVIPHAFHIIQGGRYHRQAGQHFNPYTYADIQTIADHRHYVGGNPHGGNNRSDSTGGGHAHCGLMVYLGGTWPQEYHGRMFMGNIHGRRLNVDILKAKGSGLVASHGPDFLLANDAWARFINLRYGPDGNVFVIDWYDKQACHHGDPKIWDRSNGRIYKICYRGTKPVQVDLTKKTDQELCELQMHQNEWYVRHARRLLMERASSGKQAPVQGLKDHISNRLLKVAKHEDPVRRLRGLWAMHVVGAQDEVSLQEFFKDDDAHVRAWAVQLLAERSGLGGKREGVFEGPKQLDKGRDTLQALVELARFDPSPVVRLYLASACQRLPVRQRWTIVESLLAHGEDASDANLPLMYWYAAEPLAADDAGRALALAARAKVPQILPFMVRRIGASGSPEAVALLVGALAKAEGAAAQRTILNGINEALKGRRQVAMPAGWTDLSGRLVRSTDPEVRAQAFALAVTFGDAAAFDELRRLLASSNTEENIRQQALASLLGAKDNQLPPVLHKLLAEPGLRGAALRGLAVYDDPATPAAVLKVYPALNTAEKRDALATLAARAGYAKALLDAVGTKTVAAADVSADLVRQLRHLHDKDVDRRIAEVWPVRDTPAERVQLMGQYRKMLTAAAPRPDLMLGRALFAKTCQQCHTLFGVGGKVGPDITGSNRANLDYLLENILDPSAAIPKEYAATLVELKDGRVLTGIVRSQAAAAVTLMTANETLTLPRGEVANIQASAQSMMPDDLLKSLKDDEVRTLIAYLQSPGQVPMLATTENVRDFFNGKDLAGWDGDPTLWKVENGELVGRAPALKSNVLLRSHLAAADFRLTFKVKVTPNTAKGGVLFRGEALADGGVKGYQAGIGENCWGKLSEEPGRGSLGDKAAGAVVKPGAWNEYEIVATGSQVRVVINGQACADVNDPSGPRLGIFALQLPAAPGAEVRFKELRLEVDSR